MDNEFSFIHHKRSTFVIFLQVYEYMVYSIVVARRRHHSLGINKFISKLEQPSQERQPPGIVDEKS